LFGNPDHIGHVYHEVGIEAGFIENGMIRTLYGLAVEYYERTAVRIDAASLEYCVDQRVDAEDLSVVLGVVRDEEADDEQWSYVFEELQAVARKRRYVEAFKTGLQAIRDGRPLTEVEALIDRDLFSDYAHLRGARVTDLVAEAEDRMAELEHMQEHPELYQGVPTGIAMLDDMTGGIYPSELGLIYAKPARGKSIGIQSFLMYPYLNEGYSAILGTVEMPARQIARRSDARVTGIGYNRFKRGLLDAGEMETWGATYSALAEHEQVYGNKFLIVDMPDEATVALFRQMILSQIRQQRLNAQKLVVGIDYLNLLSYGGKGRTDGGWEEITLIARELKLGVARALRLPVWTAATESEDHKGKKKIGGCYLIEHWIDLMLQLERTDYGATKMWVDKWRDGGRQNQPIRLNPDWDRAKLHTGMDLAGGDGEWSDGVRR
jgi:hypothetical protein